jgi:hypothetical protein
MKKNKLSLEKFRIAKLSNSAMISGGNVGATQTEDKEKDKPILETIFTK